MACKYITLAVICVLQFEQSSSHGSYTVPNKFFHFPNGRPFMGIFLAVAVPLGLPEHDIFMSVNVESNWNLPTNQTEFVWPPIVAKRSIERGQLYGLLANKIENFGFPGEECLLRMICEVAESKLDGHGVLGDILNTVLSPSTSEDEDVDVVYHKAEDYGKEHLHCRNYTEICPMSLLDMFTTYM